MAFGFDPSIILAQKQYTGPDANETARTLAQLSGLGLQQRHGEAQLSEMLRKQGQEQQLADIFRQGAGNPEALPQALMRGGFGSQAFAAQDQAAQMRAQKAQFDKLVQEHSQKLDKQTGEAFYGVKNQEDWTAARQSLPAEAQQMIPEAYDAVKAQRLSNLAIPADKRAQMDATSGNAEKQRAFTAGENAKNRTAAQIRAETLARQKAAGKADGKALPATVLGELADYDTADKQIDTLFEKARADDISGFGAKANQAITDTLGLQNTKAAQFEGASAPVRQGVGTILEGGKLAAGDEVKYKNMLPKYGDSEDVLSEKKKSMKAYLKTRKAERVKALQSGGYKVPDSAPGSASGKVHVSNGKETLVIDPADLADAERDGFRKVDG